MDGAGLSVQVGVTYGGRFGSLGNGACLLLSDAPRPRCFLKVSRLEAQLLLERYPECGNLLLRPSGDGMGGVSVTTRQMLNGCACAAPELRGWGRNRRVVHGGVVGVGAEPDSRASRSGDKRGLGVGQKPPGVGSWGWPRPGVGLWVGSRDSAVRTRDQSGRRVGPFLRLESSGAWYSLPGLGAGSFLKVESVEGLVHPESHARLGRGSRSVKREVGLGHPWGGDRTRGEVVPGLSLATHLPTTCTGRRWSGTTR